jgi:hypothetical protein
MLSCMLPIKLLPVSRREQPEARAFELLLFIVKISASSEMIKIARRGEYSLRRASQYRAFSHRPTHLGYVFTFYGGHKQHASWQSSTVAAVLASATLLFSVTNYYIDETVSCCDPSVDPNIGVTFEKGQSLTNWSGTHSCEPPKLFRPRNAQEVCRVLEQHQARGTKVRPVGTALSPNGIGMSIHKVQNTLKNGTDDRSFTNMISLADIDYVEVDATRKLVTVGAGATVANVLKELNRHNLTLQNFSSIQEQQMAGWTQVAAHGTGAGLPTGILVFNLLTFQTVHVLLELHLRTILMLHQVHFLTSSCLFSCLQWKK